MNRKYVDYSEITKEILDSVEVGDLIKVNDWKKPMRVKGVTENYFVMAKNQLGNTYYSVCEKKPWGGIRHNSMIGGMFHVGKDSWLFGCAGFDYKFDDEEAVKKYLQTFEMGESELSQRNAIAIAQLFIKKSN